MAVLATTGLATTGGAGTAHISPHIVPVTFALDGDRVYTAVDSKPKSSRDLRRLRNIRANPRVSLLADHYDEDWSLLWWVRADGEAAILASPAEMAGPIALLARRYPQYTAEPPAGPVISIAVGRWSGWAAAGGAQSGSGGTGNGGSGSGGTDSGGTGGGGTGNRRNVG